MAKPSLNRRGFLKISALGSGLAFFPNFASAAAPSLNSEPGPIPIPPEIEALLSELDQSDPYFTPSEKHATTSAIKIQPGSMTLDQVKAAGLDRDSWSLEITQNGEFLGQPRMIAGGNAVSFSDLVHLAEQKPVKLLKCLTDPLGSSPLGHGLWEGVALRDVLALAQPKDGSNFRRIDFVAFEAGDPKKEAARASLTASRVFEDPAGLPPVFLALKYNGDWIPLGSGGPVRLIVPEAYENKNLSFLRQIIVSREFLISDSAAKDGIDTESPVKSCAMRLYHPAPEARWAHDQPAGLVGLAQVGPSGLRGVQVALVPAEMKPEADDPYLTKLPWKNTLLLPAPGHFGAKLPGGLAGAFGINTDNGRPARWPMPFFMCRFGAVIRDLPPGKYLAYYRSVDGHGDAQPMPRPFAHSGVVDQIYHPVPFELT